MGARLSSALLDQNRIIVGRVHWGDAALRLPNGVRGRHSRASDQLCPHRSQKSLTRQIWARSGHAALNKIPALQHGDNDNGARHVGVARVSRYHVEGNDHMGPPLILLAWLLALRSAASRGGADMDLGLQIRAALKTTRALPCSSIRGKNGGRGSKPQASTSRTLTGPYL